MGWGGSKVGSRLENCPKKYQTVSDVSISNLAYKNFRVKITSKTIQNLKTEKFWI